MPRRLLVLLVCASLLGCTTSVRDRAWLDDQLAERAGARTCGRSRHDLPPEVNLDDGIDEAEVVAIALCRSPTLRAELTRIDAAFASLDEARRPANPQLSMMGPIGPITAVATLFVPLESIWQMPQRTKAAAAEANVAGEATLMRALDTVRDARLLHVELGLATERAEIRAELSNIAGDVARITMVRANAGDIGPLEERVLSADARANLDAAEAAETDVGMARARLVTSLAMADATDLRPLFSTDVAALPDHRKLVAFARTARPDAHAAEFSVSAAALRAGWERKRVLGLGALIETQWGQQEGPALRLGGRAELPIFNQNQGGIGRADAEVERAIAQHELIARAVVLEVTVTHARFEQATRSRRRFEAEVLPALDAALEAAKRSFESGDQPYLVVLDVVRRVSEARLRRAELIAEQRRALCELERALGARLLRADVPPPPRSEPPSP